MPVGTPLTIREIEMLRELRYVDGLTIPEAARRSGLSMCSVGRYAPGRPGKVPNEPARLVLERSRRTPGEVAREIGWLDSRGRADSTRLKRALGMMDETSRKPSGKVYRYRRQSVDAEVASMVAEACGVGAWEVLPDEDEVTA